MKTCSNDNEILLRSYSALWNIINIYSTSSASPRPLRSTIHARIKISSYAAFPRNDNNNKRYRYVASINSSYVYLYIFIIEFRNNRRDVAVGFEGRKEKKKKNEEEKSFEENCFESQKNIRRGGLVLHTVGVTLNLRRIVRAPSNRHDFPLAPLEIQPAQSTSTP